MNLTDETLKAVFAQLTPAERRSLEAALNGSKTAQAAAILRAARRKLKREARAARRARSR